MATEPGTPQGARARKPPPERIPVMGGPCGGMRRYPNSKVKRGWSEKQITWRHDADWYLHPSVRCRGALYVLKRDPLRYEYEPEPLVRASIAHAIGGNPFWRPWLERPDDVAVRDGDET